MIVLLPGPPCGASNLTMPFNTPIFAIYLLSLPPLDESIVLLHVCMRSYLTVPRLIFRIFLVCTRCKSVAALQL